MGVAGIEIEPGGAAAPDLALNSLGMPLASRAVAGLGQGVLSRQTATPSAPPSFRSSWQSQLASLATDADSSADSVIGEEQTSTSFGSSPSSTLGDRTSSAVAGRLGRSAFENLTESNAGSGVSKASQRTMVSNPQTALMPKNSDDRTQALTVTAGLQSQPGRSIVSDSARTSPARKSTEEDLKTSLGGDAIPAQSSLVVPSAMAATLDTQNQGQLSLQTSKRATPQEPLEGVRNDSLAIGTQSQASDPSPANPSSLPGHLKLEIQAGSKSPTLPITRDSSLTTDRVETLTVAPEQAVVRDPAVVQAYAPGPAEPSISGREPPIEPLHRHRFRRKTGVRSPDLSEVGQPLPGGLACFVGIRSQGRRSRGQGRRVLPAGKRSSCSDSWIGGAGRQRSGSSGSSRPPRIRC